MGYSDIKEKADAIFEKADAQLSNEKFSFLSQVDLSDEEFNFLKSNFDIICVNSSPNRDVNIYPIARVCNLLTCIVLVNFGFTYYDDKGYWEKFKDYIGRNSDFTSTEITKFRRLVENTSLRYNLTINYEIKGESIRKNVNAILVQTFVPYNYLGDFFDYAYTLYDEIRDDERYNNLYGFFEELSANFKVPLDQNNPQSTALGGNKLINSTKRVMRDPDAFGPILEKIFTRIDSNNTLSEDTDLGRFEEKFNEWFKKNQEIVHRGRGHRHRTAKFVLDGDNRLRLIVPSQAIGDGMTRGLLVLTSPGVPDAVAEPPLKSDSSLKKIEEFKFGRTLEFFEEFELFLNDKNITPSTNAGRFIIFNSYREQIDSPVAGLFYVAVNDGVEISADNYNLYTTRDSVRIFVVRGEPGSTITIGDRQYFIGKTLNKVRASIGSFDSGIICKTDSGSIPVLPKHPTVCFDVGRKTARKTGIELINNDKIVCKFRLSHAQEDTNKVLKLVDPNSGPNMDNVPGKYSLKIRIGDVTENYEYFLAPGVCVHFAERIYREECFSWVVFDSALFSEKEFNTADDAVEWTQTIGQLAYDFSLPIPSMKYDLGYGEMFDRKLRLDDIGTSIEVKCPLFSRPRLVIKYDNEKTYRENSMSKYLYFDISDMKNEIERRHSAKCVLLLSEGGNEEEIVSIDTPSVVKISENEDRTILSIYALHISGGSELLCVIETLEKKEKTGLVEGKPCEIDITNSCKVTVKEITEQGKVIIHFEGSFNFIQIKQDTNIRGDCKSIEPSFLISVDSRSFYIDGGQFYCMLNNEFAYDPNVIMKNCEDRWSRTLGINHNDKTLKSMFMKACNALQERIIHDELERGNKEALANLLRKYENTRYYTQFYEAYHR